MTTSTVTIEMAGLACAVATREQALAELLAQRYEGFLSTRSPRFTLSVMIDPTPVQSDPLEVDPAPVSMTRRGHRLLLSGDHCAAEFDLESRTGAMTLPLNLTPLDLFLKVLYAHYLLEDDAFFVHACAVGRPGGGDLFFGPSGSGKSTLAGLAGEAGAPVLADELVIVQRQGDAFAIHGTPFWGGRNSATAVSRLYALSAEHRSDAIAPLPPVRALRRLLSCAGNFSPDAGSQSRLFALAASLAQTIRCQELHFATTTSMKGWLNAHLC